MQGSEGAREAEAEEAVKAFEAARRPLVLATLDLSDRRAARLRDCKLGRCGRHSLGVIQEARNT